MTISILKRGMICSAVALLPFLLSARAQEPPPPADVPFVIAGAEMNYDGKVVKAAPYSAQAMTETTQTLADGNHIHRKLTSAVYRDSEGRTRREQGLTGLGPWSVSGSDAKQMVFINDPVAGVRYVLDSTDHTAHKLPTLKTGQAGLRHVFVQKSADNSSATADQKAGAAGWTMAAPPPSEAGANVLFFEKHLNENGANSKSESLGEQVIEGVVADGTRTTTTIAAGQIGNDQPIQIVSERWYSPELQTVVMSKRTDPRVGETVYRVTNIDRTEPAASLFQVPPDYKIEDAPSPTTEYKPKASGN